MKTITSKVDLETTLQNDVEVALDKTVEELMLKLEEILTNNVYRAYTPSNYIRTGQLISNWDATKATLKRGIIESELGFTLPLAYSDEPNYSHGISHLENNSLLEIIESGNYGGAFGSNLRSKIGGREFWNEFCRYCDTNFERIFYKHMSKS